jgi:hypothetical protein
MNTSKVNVSLNNKITQSVCMDPKKVNVSSFLKKGSDVKLSSK